MCMHVHNSHVLMPEVYEERVSNITNFPFRIKNLDLLYTLRWEVMEGRGGLTGLEISTPDMGS